ncbi:MAG: hypothetical protein ACYDIE_07495 [Candidatus Krumholzibacteriia bacterium]
MESVSREIAEPIRRGWPQLKKALALATVCGLLLPAAKVLAIAKPAPGDAPAAAPHTGLPPNVLVAMGVLVLLAVGAVVWWYRAGRKR